jgi:hypothetical protein
MESSRIQIAKISQDILDHMLLFRYNNSGFTFRLRERDSSRSKEKRLERGQWFHGSDYIFVGLFSASDSIRKVPTIGFVVDFTKEGAVDNCHLTISFKGGFAASNEISFHQELASELGIVLDKNNRGEKRYSSNDYIVNLNDCLSNVYPLTKKLLIKYGLVDKYFIKEDKFVKQLSRVNIIQGRLKNHTTDAKANT